MSFVRPAEFPFGNRCLCNKDACMEESSFCGVFVTNTQECLKKFIGSLGSPRAKGPIRHLCGRRSGHRLFVRRSRGPGLIDTFLSRPYNATSSLKLISREGVRNVVHF